MSPEKPRSLEELKAMKTEGSPTSPEEGESNAFAAFREWAKQFKDLPLRASIRAGELGLLGGAGYGGYKFGEWFADAANQTSDYKYIGAAMGAGILARLLYGETREDKFIREHLEKKRKNRRGY